MPNPHQLQLQRHVATADPFRGISRWSVALFCGLFAMNMTQSFAHAGDETRPNILFCFADDWGWPHGGAYGDDVVSTPGLDRIAREGALFEQAFVSAPTCTASRNAIITGQAFYRLGQGANLHSTLDVTHPNFVTLLSEAGYATGHWRKAWGPGDFRIGGYEQHPCGPPVSFDEFLGKHDPNQPFCFWFGTSDPHRRYELGSGAEAGIDVDRVSLPAFYPDDDEIRGDVADYYFEVERFNREVDAAMKELDQLGLLDNTIVVISGDHGMPFPRCKGNLYDWGSRVPLAIRWPAEVPAGRVVTDPVSLTDLAPTFLDAAGVKVPDVMTGQSLLPMLTSESVEVGRDFVIIGRERHVPAQAIPSVIGYPSRAIRTDDHLYIVNFEPGRWPMGVPEGATHPIGWYADCDDGPTKQVIAACDGNPDRQKYYDLCFAKRPAEELYVLATDPDQIDNRIDDPELADVAEDLRTRLFDELRRTGDPRAREGVQAPFDDYPYRAKYPLRLTPMNPAEPN